MKKIIVTVTNKEKSFCYDVEVPTNLTLDKLYDDIAQSLIGYKPNMTLKADSARIYSTFCKKMLGNTDTLESAGVWNGDILILN